MTTTTAARAAVDPRPARGTAGRRAVQVVLLVLFLGGLLALGILAGGRAEAQERPDPGLLTAPEQVAEKVVEPVTETVTEPGTEKVAVPVVEKAVKPVDRAAKQQAAEQQAAEQQAAEQQAAEQQATVESSVKPTVKPSAAPAAEPPAPADVLGSAPARVSAAVVVVAGVGDAVDRVAGEVRPLVPALPGLPPLFSVLPVPGGEPAAPGAPSPSVPDTGRGAEDGTTAPGDAGTDTSAERAAGRDRGVGAPGSASDASDVPDGSGVQEAGPAQGSAPTQAPDRAPFDPCGDLVRTATADVQGPRGGDLHAVPAQGGPYAALVRGAGLPATAAPIPDRSGEILAFPG
ncbi:hypothetical protein ACIQPT_10555 [Streptomyces sp. NPDC091289]|uniref:hypothetical protein n=1 Tax=Streptomyces sp. NPDC091289 TaxID=3365989 RepID=UPI0037FB8EB3